jgi:fructokinase
VNRISHEISKTMARKRHTIVGLGELLWDLLPNGKQLGGAPANFAYITSLLGNEGIPVSRIGQDDLGGQVIQRLTELGLPASYVQEDANHATGTVRVQLEHGQPCFEISGSVAWDFLEWTPQWKTLAEQADAICFGSLAQRSIQSRSTIGNFLRAASPDVVRVFDANLRQNFYDVEVLSKSMELANIVKLNHEELQKTMALIGMSYENDENSAKQLIGAFNLKLICITRGSEGSLLMTPNDRNSHPGFRVEIADTVGAGDAFTAALVHEYLLGESLADMNEMANRMGAWVASEVGATPALKPEGLEKTLAAIG